LSVEQLTIMEQIETQDMGHQDEAKSSPAKPQFGITDLLVTLLACALVAATVWLFLEDSRQKGIFLKLLRGVSDSTSHKDISRNDGESAYFLFLPSDEESVRTSYLAAHRRWKSIVVHCSGTGSGNAQSLDKFYRQKHELKDGLPYHFVVCNGKGSPDGAIEVGSRWLRDLTGAHCQSSTMNADSIGICVIGDFDSALPSKTQAQALVGLIHSLQTEFQIPSQRVYGHSEVDQVKTDCPGARFSMRDLRAALSKKISSPQQGLASGR
jgi:N-acetylmuramoyl-L-alanine amidase